MHKLVNIWFIFELNTINRKLTFILYIKYYNEDKNSFKKYYSSKGRLHCEIVT